MACRFAQRADGKRTKINGQKPPLKPGDWPRAILNRITREEVGELIYLTPLARARACAIFIQPPPLYAADSCFAIPRTRQV